MTRDELVHAIIKERKRIFPEDADTGSNHAYAWLLQHYDLTQEEDNTWIDILDVLYNGESLEEVLGFGPDDEHDAETFAEIQRFLADDEAVHTFLTQLLQKYRGSQAVYNS